MTSSAFDNTAGEGYAAAVVTVYRDRSLIVVDKPAGMPTQSARDGDDDLFSQVRREFPRAALHHRLDQPASGLVLFAVDPAVNAAIAAGFREHTIQRSYRAVLVGEARDGTWDGAIDGKPARTDVTAVGRGEGMTAVELRLHTGRTHQIRIHAARAGRPIAGDRYYGGEAGTFWPRLALHAWRMTLAHPVSGEALTVESPLPADLIMLWGRAGGR
jgi:23S rRNA pseudouridine1911/1915/1917 synthase